MSMLEIKKALVTGLAVALGYVGARAGYEFILQRGATRTPAAVESASSSTSENKAPQSALEQFSQKQNAIRKAGDNTQCAADAKKFCPDSNWKDGGMGKCLFNHLYELQPACFVEYPRLFVAIKDCWSDIVNLCREVKPGDGRIPACLRQKGASVSEACRKSPYIAH